jgi:hypothetical protein
MLFRSGRQLELVLDDPVSSVPRTLLPSGDCAEQCALYAMCSCYPAPVDWRIWAMITCRRSENSMPRYDVLKDVRNRGSHIVIDYRDNHNLLASITGNIRDVLSAHCNSTEPTFIAPFVGKTIQAPLRIADGKFELTGIIRASPKGVVFFGRQLRGEWYSYNSLTGVVRVQSKDVTSCIRAIGRSSKNKTFVLYYSNTEWPIERLPDPAFIPIPQELEYTTDELNNWKPVLTYQEPCYISADGKTTLIPKIDRSLSVTRGIVNLGQTCHFNAVMQLLARMDGLEDVPDETSSIPTILQELFRTELGAITLDADVVKTRGCREENRLTIKTFEQHDARETLEYIHTIAGIKQYFSDNVDITETTGNEIMCTYTGCDPTRRYPPKIKTSPVFGIGIGHLPANATVALQSIIDYRIEQEKTHKLDQNNLHRFECDQNHVQFIRDRPTVYTDFKKYVILHINLRKEWDDPDRHNPTLTKLDHFEINANNYETVAVVLQTGNGQGGHYIAIAKAPGSKFMTYNDDVVTGPSDSIETAQSKFVADIFKNPDDISNVTDKSLLQAIANSLDQKEKDASTPLPYLILGRRLGDAA